MDIVLEKFKGTLLGGALGDAIGKSLEDVPFEEVISFYGGAVRGFVEPHPHSPSVGLEPEQTTDETKSLEPHHFFSKLKEWAGKEEIHRYPDPTLITAIDLISSGVGLDDAGLVSSSVEGVLRCTITSLYGKGSDGPRAFYEYCYNTNGLSWSLWVGSHHSGLPRCRLVWQCKTLRCGGDSAKPPQGWKASRKACGLKREATGYVLKGWGLYSPWHSFFFKLYFHPFCGYYSGYGMLINKGLLTAIFHKYSV